MIPAPVLLVGQVEQAGIEGQVVSQLQVAVQVHQAMAGAAQVRNKGLHQAC